MTLIKVQIFQFSYFERVAVFSSALTSIRNYLDYVHFTTPFRLRTCHKRAYLQGLFGKSANYIQQQLNHLTSLKYLKILTVKYENLRKNT